MSQRGSVFEKICFCFTGKRNHRLLNVVFVSWMLLLKSEQVTSGSRLWIINIQLFLLLWKLFSGLETKTADLVIFTRLLHKFDEAPVFYLHDLQKEVSFPNALEHSVKSHWVLKFIFFVPMSWLTVEWVVVFNFISLHKLFRGFDKTSLFITGVALIHSSWRAESVESHIFCHQRWRGLRPH